MISIMGFLSGLENLYIFNFLYSLIKHYELVILKKVNFNFSTFIKMLLIQFFINILKGNMILGYI